MTKFSILIFGAILLTAANWSGSSGTPTAPVRVADGSVGTPAYSFTSDTNTGMFLLTADTLSFAIGGTSKLVLAGTDFNIAASTTSNYLSGTSVLKFWNTAGTFGVTLRGHATQTGNTTFQLPISNGTSGYILSTDGAGVTSWVARHPQVASASATLTLAQCGSTIVSNSADVEVLPEASTVLGCRYTFVCGTADDFDIDPGDATDHFGPALTTAAGVAVIIDGAAGDEYRCTDIGSSMTVEAILADQWAIIGATNGPWTDVD